MDTKEAHIILKSKVDSYRTAGYATLREWVLNGTVKTEEVVGDSGDNYQVELEVFWDDKAKGTIRFLGSIDNGRFSWRRILKSDITHGFIIAPDGTFIGE